MNKNNQKDVTFYYERAIDKDDLGDLEGTIKEWRKAAELGDKDAKKIIQKYKKEFEKLY